MSSLGRVSKNAQRVHRERSQPLERRHLGRLEKKKDYKERSEDFHKKRDAITTLHKKAQEKNPDEFYFHMINSKTEDGVHFEKEKSPDEDSKIQQKLLESRDLRYVKFKRDLERKKIEKLKSNLHFTDSGSIQPNKHTVFLDSKEEAKNFNPAHHFGTDESLVGRTFNRPKLETLEKTAVKGAHSKASVQASDRARQNSYQELVKRMQREKELSIVTNKLQLRKNLAESKGVMKPKRVVRGSSSRAPVYKWQFERKR